MVRTSMCNASRLQVSFADFGGSVGNTLYVYVFLSVMVVIGFGSVAVYCYHRRRIQRFVDHDNMNNNMQRHSLVDR